MVGRPTAQARGLVDRAAAAQAGAAVRAQPVLRLGVRAARPSAPGAAPRLVLSSWRQSAGPVEASGASRLAAQPTSLGPARVASTPAQQGAPPPRPTDVAVPVEGARPILQAVRLGLSAVSPTAPPAQAGPSVLGAPCLAVLAAGAPPATARAGAAAELVARGRAPDLAVPPTACLLAGPGLRLAARPSAS